MIEQICTHVHNYFEVDQMTGRRLLHQGRFTVENGRIELPFLENGQYFRVFGSRFNDGVHQYPTDSLTDETFNGVVWEMRPPRDFLELVGEITAWVEKYGDVTSNPYSSESVIGVYAYTKDSSAGTSWQQVFKHRLNAYRKLY